MITRVLFATLGVALGLAILPLLAQAADKPAGTNLESPASARRFPKNAEEFDRLFEEVKGWGRWGADDQLGALNLVTDQKRKQAAGLVKLGHAISLAHTLLMEPALDNARPFERSMILTYPDSATDSFKAYYHGTAHTHLDSLCHLYHKGKTYNGYPASETITDKGCTRLGVENLKNGVVTRAVIIDIPRLRNVPYLEPGTAVFQDEIEAWEKKTGVRVSAGDAVFLRTGRWARRAALGPWDIHKYGAAGFHASVVPWFKARGVAIVGSDAEMDVLPSRVEGVEVPVHSLFIVALGVVVLDNLDLEAAADTAERLERWQFMVDIAPLQVIGSTGSPVNPIAMF